MSDNNTNYVEMDHGNNNTPMVTTPGAILASLATLSPHEIATLRQMLDNGNLTAVPSKDEDDADANSEYSEFPETTHAWAVYAEKPKRKATKMDRFVGTMIILFQIFTYGLFANEAIEDYQHGSVPVLTTHNNCQASNEEPQDNFTCEAEYTSHWDAFVAFSMLSIFLTPEILQAARCVLAAPFLSPSMMFACLAGIEVVFAYIAATVCISYQLYIGEVTDAIEVGVGLLFIRELSARAYHGIRHKGVKQYKSFIGMLASLLLAGFVIEALCESSLGRGGGEVNE